MLDSLGALSVARSYFEHPHSLVNPDTEIRNSFSSSSTSIRTFRRTSTFTSSSTTIALTSTRTSNDGSGHGRDTGVHYTPTYASWLNQVEIWFGIITQKAIRRGTFKNVKDLINCINTFANAYNANSRPFVWTSTADSILQKLNRLLKLIHGTRHWRHITKKAPSRPLRDGAF